MGCGLRHPLRLWRLIERQTSMQFSGQGPLRLNVEQQMPVSQ